MKKKNKRKYIWLGISLSHTQLNHRETSLKTGTSISLFEFWRHLLLKGDIFSGWNDILCFGMKARVIEGEG
ncbi:hypothetical protein G4B88_006650 [Cannabis sativa]|uniref:Uncharacterized protein n=1 Tax=Cannabis sativa TaxID=3483 RepID=A0A7J6GGN5_CANSA|nr:hypothetical protein G4B88_006650 [Cannabis sativa]